MDDVKVCKNCTHYKTGFCHHPQNMTIDLVEGGRKAGASGYVTCGTLRSSHSTSENGFWCYPEGKHFSLKQQARKWWHFWR